MWEEIQSLLFRRGAPQGSSNQTVSVTAAVTEHLGLLVSCTVKWVISSRWGLAGINNDLGVDWRGRVHSCTVETCTLTADLYWNNLPGLNLRWILLSKEDLEVYSSVISREGKWRRAEVTTHGPVSHGASQRAKFTTGHQQVTRALSSVLHPKT